MHIGNLRTALYAYFYARKNNGTFIIRIEDTDQERYVEGAVDMIFSTLRQAGIDYDEGGEKGGPFAPYTQSERKDVYLEYAKKLIEKGGAYYCFCDKERLEGLTDENGIKKYDKHCLALTPEQIQEKLNSGEPYVIRQNIPKEGESVFVDLVFGEIKVNCSELEDGVLIKSDGMPTYNFANVIDDHLMNITHVIRGSEFISSTPKFNLIYDSFGWKRPEYMHLSPIMKDKERKLSKRYGDANFNDFIEKGYLSEAIVNYIALLGWSPQDNREKMSIDELIQAFDVEGISKSGSIFDEEKLKWLNSLYIKELPLEKFLELGAPYYAKSGAAAEYDWNLFGRILHSRVDYLAEIPQKTEFLTSFGEYDIDILLNQKLKIDKELAARAIAKAKATLEGVEDFTNENLFAVLTAAAEECGVNKKQMLWCVRVGITGVAVTPGGATELAEILGKERTLQRLSFSLNRLI
jgi:glutamyl-tRNA synthetase